MLVGLRRLLSPGDSGVRPLPQPVGQRPATKLERDGRCPLGYRSSRLSSTVPTTEATTENRIISRQPGQPPRGRIWIRPGRTGWLLRFRVADRSQMALLRSLTIGGPATTGRDHGMAGQWRRLLPGHAK